MKGRRGGGHSFGNQQERLDAGGGGGRGGPGADLLIFAVIERGISMAIPVRLQHTAVSMQMRRS